MNSEEAMKLAVTIKAFYPRDFKNEDKKEMLIRVAIIQNLFKNFSYDLVYEAFHNLTKKKPEWCPSLAEIETEAESMEKYILSKRLDEKYPEKYIIDTENRNYIENKDYQKEKNMIKNGELHLKDLKAKELIEYKKDDGKVYFN